MEAADFFTFDKFVAPTLIKVIYWIGLVIIALSTLAGLVGMSMFDSYVSTGFNVGHAVMVLLMGALFVLLWRVMCEIWIVIFSINDRLGQLVNRDKPAADVRKELSPTA